MLWPARERHPSERPTSKRAFRETREEVDQSLRLHVALIRSVSYCSVPEPGATRLFSFTLVPAPRSCLLSFLSFLFYFTRPRPTTDRRRGSANATRRATTDRNIIAYPSHPGYRSNARGTISPEISSPPRTINRRDIYHRADAQTFWTSQPTRDFRMQHPIPV